MDNAKLSSFSRVFADMHIHIGRAASGEPVKITASRQMTFTEIIHEAHHRKGLHMIGVIDAHSPPVQAEILAGLESGEFWEHPQGGIVYQDVTCILGAEIEIKEPSLKPIHILVYFPTLNHMRRFTRWLARYTKNVQLSTQRLYRSAKQLVDRVLEDEGLIIPAHIFTPFKSVYGAIDRIGQLFPLKQLAAVELGLSSDQQFADQISELADLPFITNSDAHSTSNLGREYNEYQIKEPSFQEWKKALQNQDGRTIIANYGLDPRLGKYYRSRCLNCGERWPAGKGIRSCPKCGSCKHVKGVLDRINELADQQSKASNHRPPYIHQIPLRWMHRLGPKTLQHLLHHFGTEMRILHYVGLEEIAEQSHPLIAEQIGLARQQRLGITEGGGGRYGKVKKIDSHSQESN